MRISTSVIPIQRRWLEGVFTGASFIKGDGVWCDMWLYSIFAPGEESIIGGR